MLPLHLRDHLDEGRQEQSEKDYDPHLRSEREVIGYKVKARDGEVGQIKDLIAEIDYWDIRYLVVDTGGLFSTKRVLLLPAWIQSVDWLNRSTRVDLTTEQVEKSPEYDPSAPINKELEEQFYDYYGRNRTNETAVEL